MNKQSTAGCTQTMNVLSLQHKSKKATPAWHASASLALEEQPAWAYCVVLSHHPEPV